MLINWGTMREKHLVLLILFLYSTVAFSQRKISGTVVDKNNNEELIIGAQIQEEGTGNHVFSDIDGKFEIVTLKDTCVLIISMLGFECQSFKITSDIEQIVRLGYYDYTSKWITVGADYDFINSKFGVRFSNGYDEQPLIHFEDFPDRFIYKASFRTGFNKDYGFGGAIGWLYPTRHIDKITLEYDQVHYSGKDRFKYRNISITGVKYLGFINSDIILRAGFQSLNEHDNLGVSFGIQKVLLYNKLYSGLSAGYYGDYWIYSVYAQSFIYSNKWGLRLSYDRINRFDFLALGINFTIPRSK